MRHIPNPLILFALLITGACADSPMTPVALSPDVAPVADEVQGCIGDGLCELPGITTPGEPDEPPDCDMWWKPDCGACATSAIGSPEDMQGTSGCPGGGTGPAPVGDPYNPGGGSGGTGTPSDPYAGSGAFQEGPLAWAVCVLTVIGGVYSVDQVADRFVEWWNAQQELQQLRRALDFTLSMQRDGYEYDPAALNLLFFQVDEAVRRRDNAIGAVKDATNTSYLALAGAALACGAAALAPTP
jgi:hypothetical protein